MAPTSQPAQAVAPDEARIALPGGKTGEVTVAIEASVDQVSGLVTALEREATTRLGDSTRVTIETWTLAPRG
ncbi:MAG: hypothetical protein FJX31_00875 [Alphaproteobacteria bacterium]|nr:hypothetical protein [Alphaproteobacteria bacterium]